MNCYDYWCDNYDKNNGYCDNCVKKEHKNDNTKIHAVMQKRDYEQMELDNDKKGQQNSL